ncbi:MAG: alpha/beta hydrolase [Candidatus Solibacter usitatus]|nr:alpha/beta hydrolase [Candidatus Solibacter usitatus]
MFRLLPLLLPLCAWTQTDGAQLVVGGIHRFLDNYSVPPSTPTRARLSYILGVQDAYVSGSLEIVASPFEDAVIARAPGFAVKAVRWPVTEEMWGEGLLLQPAGNPVASVIALGDADWTPEMLAGLAPGLNAEMQFARRLAENGAQVLIPLLMDRKATYSGAREYRMTNMPHREFLWRILYPLGRHIIGVEVMKVIAATSKLSVQPARVIGYGEGGLIAMHAAALSDNIAAVAVSGYFGPRDQLWREPVYRDVWGLLPDYRDASVASLIAPRTLIVENAPGPAVTGPPAESKERRGASPHGTLAPEIDAAGEVARISGKKPLVVRAQSPGSAETLKALLSVSRINPPGPEPVKTRTIDAEDRFRRQFDQIINYSRRIIRQSNTARAEVWSKADRSSVEKWTASVQDVRTRVWNDLIGKLPTPSMPANPRLTPLFETPKLRSYEVILDVYPNVPAYGWLLVPKDIAPGERRPVVVCQHGLEGRPKNVADPAFVDKTYGQFAVRLAERGFITFSPQNSYVLGDQFRQIGRKAHPWRLTQFSFLTAMHQRILEWLGTLPYADAKRIGFYGLSYGGYTAMRIPALLDNYALSICSGSFTEWVWKVASLDAPYTYPLTQEYDIPEFNFANLVNHAELASLIFPRPFFVERGHKDGVSSDEWVAYEYAKVFRFYTQMGLRERTAIEYFDGPHQIHGVGTFEFLEKHLTLHR